MPLTDASAIQDHTQIKQEAAGKVEKFTPMAEARLRQLITDDKYEAIEGDDTHDGYDTLKRAESLMSLYFGFQYLNLRPTEIGGFTRVIGYGDSNQMLMSGKELQAYRGRTYDMAVELIDDIRDVLPQDANKFEDVDPGSFDAGPFTIG